MGGGRYRSVRLAAFGLLTTAALSCTLSSSVRPPAEPPPPNLRPTRIDYVDSDAFDAVLEAALVNQDPVILIQTTYEKPEWGERLNAWIAAWNRGGPARKVRMQAPLLPKVVVDGDSIREFRLLVGGLMDRVEDSVRQGTTWWAQEKVRNRRVDLLKPYNLRFHLDDEGHVEVIFFNGRYAPYHAAFVRSIADTDTDCGEEWDRGYHCSRRKQPHDERAAPGRLTRATPTEP